MVQNLIKKRIVNLVLILLPFLGFSQQEDGVFSLSLGTGHSFSNTAIKTAVDFGLKEAGIKSKVSTTWMVNGALDYKFHNILSLGVAYSHFQFYWSDVFEKEVQGTNNQIAAGIDVLKRNYAIRLLAHYRKSGFSLYGGVRGGFTAWKFIFEPTVTTDANLEDYIPVSDFSFPVSVPSIQVVTGFKFRIVNPVWFFGEFAVGTAPYWINAGLSFDFKLS